MIKYVVCGGWVRGRGDWDQQFITPNKLVELYKVDPAECIKIRHYNDKHGFTRDYLEKLIWLTPREDGNYSTK